MERLTMNNGGCKMVGIDSRFCREQKDCYNCEHGRKCFKRLAAYEDTGLTPDEIVAAANRRHDCKIDCLLEVHNKLLDEIAQFGGIDRIREIMRPPNDPLTLEQLREMDGEPVWVCEPNGANGVWGLVDLEYQMIRLHGGGLAIWENNDKSWMAYHRKPEEGTP